MTAPHPSPDERTDLRPDGSPAVRLSWRTGVWLLLVAGAVGNSVASLASVPVSVHLALSLLCGACLVLLVAAHLRRR